MTYLSYGELAAEVERLREENMELRHELELRKDGEEGQPKTVYLGGRKKGTGACYDVVRLNYQHRKILYGLLSLGAISRESGVPAVQLRRELRIGQGPLAGRVAEMIRKSYVDCEKARVTFQMDSSGSWQYRPEVQVDPKTSVRYYKRFKYRITEAGKQKLLETVQPSDDFVKADVKALIEIKEAAEARGVEKVGA